MLKTVKYTFWNIYDNFPQIIILNIIWTLIHLPILILLLNMDFLVFEKLTFLKPLLFYFTNNDLSGFDKVIVTTRNTLYLFSFLMYSPFSLAIFRFNREIAIRSKHLSVKYFFHYFKKYLLKSITLLITNLLFILISFYLYRYYYNIFYSKTTSLFYITSSGFALFLFIYLAIKFYAVPIVINENKNYLNASKRAYYITTSNPLKTLLIVLFYFSFFYLILKIPQISALFLVSILFPSIPGQIIFENYFSVTEKYGNSRPFKENRTLKNIFSRPSL